MSKQNEPALKSEATVGELKPCPFCGCDSKARKIKTSVMVYFVVQCEGCLAYGPHFYTTIKNGFPNQTEDKAIEFWNRRKEATKHD
jgi:Lar family restriction alleviation protein